MKITLVSHLCVHPPVTRSRSAWCLSVVTCDWCYACFFSTAIFRSLPITVMYHVNTQALMNFAALFPPALIQDRRLFQTRRLLFSEREFMFLSMKSWCHIGIQYIIGKLTFFFSRPSSAGLPLRSWWTIGAPSVQGAIPMSIFCFSY